MGADSKILISSYLIHSSEVLEVGEEVGLVYWELGRIYCMLRKSEMEEVE